MNNQNIELYIWPNVLEGNGKAASDNFKPLVIKEDIKAAIGAGASGLLPELNLLLVVTSSLILSGFLNAVGEDGWKLIKKGVAKLANKKPQKNELSLPPNFKGSIQYELIWWIHFNDTRILIIIGLSSESEVLVAMNLLPQAIDAAFKEGGEFSRLVWNGKNWDRY